MQLLPLIQGEKMENNNRKHIGYNCYLCTDSTPYYLLNETNNKKEELKNQQYLVLSYLVNHANEEVTLEDLAKYVWGVNYDIDACSKSPTSLVPYISKIKKEKLNKIHDRLKYCCHTNHGYGSYTWKIEMDDNAETYDMDETYIRKAPISSYMNQCLLSSDDFFSNACLFNLEKDSLEFFVDNKLLFIVAPGGQGKSLFLERLQYRTNDSELITKTFRVSLIDLTTKIEMGLANLPNIIYYYIEEVYKQNILDEPNLKYIIALDGYNEFKTAKNKEAIKLIMSSIEEIVEEIKNKIKTNISLVITTRGNLGSDNRYIIPGFESFRYVTLSGTNKENYEDLKEKCKEKGILFDGKKEISEIGKLAKIPMYANLLVELFCGSKNTQDEGEINTVYDLFFKAYERRALQRIGNKRINQRYNESEYLYYYYIYLPYIAYYVLTSKSNMVLSEYSFHDRDLFGISRYLRENEIVSSIYEKIRNRYFPHIQRGVPNIGAFDITEYFFTEGSFILKDDSYRVFRFGHESWRDFLTALYLKNIIEYIKDHYLSTSVIPIQISVNVNGNVAKMVRQSLKLDGTEEENDVHFCEYFSVKESLNNLGGKLKILNLAFDVVEYLQVSLSIGPNGENEALHRVFSPFSSLLLNCRKNPALINDISQNKKLKQCACGILSKESEYYRRIKDYETVIDILDFCENIAPENDLVKNQKAKLYLSLAQSVTLEDNSSIPSNIEHEDTKSIFKRGMDLLGELSNTGFYLSGNLFGLIYSYPAPYLLKSNNLKIERDYNKAFIAHITSIFKSDQNGHDIHHGREISYSVRQALSLIFKKNVRVDENSSYSPTEDYGKELSNLILMPYSSENKMNSKTLELSKFLLQKAEGQSLKGMNYLRACLFLALASHDKENENEYREKAKEYLESPLKDELTILYKIRLIFEFGLKESVDPLFEKLAKKASDNQFGVYDRTHHIYNYLDAKNLLISYLKGNDLEKQIHSFNDLEKKFSISELCALCDD